MMASVHGPLHFMLSTLSMGLRSVKSLLMAETVSLGIGNDGADDGKG